MSVTNRQRTHRWVVWEVEYAEDGSTEVRARTRAGAIVAYRRMTGADNELSAAPLTPGLAKTRWKLELKRHLLGVMP